MSTRELWSKIIGLAVGALISGVLLAGLASATDEIVLGAAVSQTGKYAREGKFYVDAYTLTVDAVNKAGGVKVGGTGTILTVKALYELERIGGRYALMTMCIGGGQGIAAIFERLG